MVFAIGLGLPDLLLGADCGTSLTIDSRTEYYLTASDILDSISPDIPGPIGEYIPNPLKIPGEVSKAAQIIDIIQGRCFAVDFFSGGISLQVGPGLKGGATGNGWFKWKTSHSAFSDHVRKVAKDIVVNNDLGLIKPDFKPCDPPPILTLASVGGDIAGTVTDFGIGLYPRRTTHARLRLCRDLVVENASGSAVEVPVSLSGSIHIDGGIAADDAVGRKNYAKAWLKVFGTIGDQSISEKAEVSASGFELAGSPESTVNSTRRITLGAPGRTNTVHIDISCEGFFEIQAHGSAFMGFIGDSVSGQLSFPDSVGIGWPTGPNGSPLPPGVRIYDADDGSVYADTNPNPLVQVPVGYQTAVWRFDEPLDSGLGGLIPAVHTANAYGSSTLVSPVGTGNGILRRSSTVGDPVSNVTNHNAFHLAYTVEETNSTPSITVFVYDETGELPHSLAYDLSLDPGYHEVTLPFADGDATGRGLFAVGGPDLSRMHSIAVANTVFDDWQKQSSGTTTGQVAVTFHHLAAITAAPTGAEGFMISNHFVDPSNTLHLLYPASISDYYVLYAGSNVTAVTNPVSLALGGDGSGEFQVRLDPPGPTAAAFRLPGLLGAAAPAATSFFRLREVSLADPLDLDGDGVDDVTELKNPAIYNPLVPATTIVTNEPPVPGGTNTPSNTGQRYYWTANGHTYVPVAVNNGIAWAEADATARAAGGHLATVSSAAENAFVFSLIDRPEYWQPAGTPPCCNSGPWLGAVQADGAAEPSGGWQWSTGEPFGFGAWFPGEPNDGTAPSDSDRLTFFASPANARSDKWNDTAGTRTAPGYIIEIEPVSTGGDCMPRDGLIAWWKGDGNALDSVGSSSGALMHGVSFSRGIVGDGFSLDGVDDYLSIPNSTVFGFANFTVAGWVKTTSTNLMRIVSQQDAPLANYWLMGLDNGSLRFGSSLDAVLAPMGPPLNDGRWHHVAVVRDTIAHQALWFADGILVGTATASSDAAYALGNSVMIGRFDSGSDTGQYFAGQLDEITIFGRVLTAEEIAAIYTGGLTGKCGSLCFPPPQGLVAWWPGEGTSDDRISGNKGAVLSGALFAAGKVGQAFHLDGIDDFVGLDSAASILGRDAFAIECWLRTTNRLGYMYVLSQRSDKVYNGEYTLLIARGTVRWTTYGDGDYGFDGTGYAPGSKNNDSGTDITDGIWHHVVATREVDGTGRVWVDGKLDWEQAAPPRTLVQSDIYLGVDQRDWKLLGQEQADFFQGDLDEISIYKRSLTPTEVAGLFAAGSAGKCQKRECPDLPSGLVSWWPADGSGDDFVGRHNGALNAGILYASGIVGQAFRFDGIGSFVSYPTLDFDDIPTLAMWIQTGNGDQGIIDAGAGPGDYFGWRVGIDQDGHVYYQSYRNGTGGYVMATGRTVITDGRFHHVVVTTDSAARAIRVFIDGVEDGEYLETASSFTSWASTEQGSVKLGKCDVKGLPVSSFAGLVDDMMLFNRVLRPSEITTLYQSVTPPAFGGIVDHGGTNWTVTAGTVLSGSHVNIGEFVVPEGVRADVAPYDGGNGGLVEVRARMIRVDGTIDANGKGYPDGGGGGGGGGADQLVVNGGQPGRGAGGGDGHLGGAHGEAGDDGGETTGGRGGRGRAGMSSATAAFAGVGGSPGSGAAKASDENSGGNGHDGGYLGTEINADGTVGDEVEIGSGGGGGGGGGGGHSSSVNSGGGGGGGGAAGGNGGGVIVLRASLKLEVNGSLLAQGQLGGPGAGGRSGSSYNQQNDPSPGGAGGPGGTAADAGSGLGGTGGRQACDTFGDHSGHCSGQGGGGGNGGAGAGGGILLRAPLVSVSGVIDNSGGRSTTNGGTLKIYSACGGANVTGHITTGRRVERPVLMRSSGG